MGKPSHCESGGVVREKDTAHDFGSGEVDIILAGSNQWIGVDASTG